jgi:hypothetical protein
VFYIRLGTSELYNLNKYISKLKRSAEDKFQGSTRLRSIVNVVIVINYNYSVIVRAFP